MNGLEVDVRVPERHVDATFTVPTGRTLALLGPNGTGKSTVADAVAGLILPASGSVTVAGRTVFGEGVRVPAHRRSVALLGQNTRLFPHLSVRANVAFAPRSAGASRRDAAAAADHWLDAVGAEQLRDRRPTELSGGQAQRVALARALAARPQVLLLDEPLSALDVAARSQVRTLLRDLIRDLTCVVITHDAADVVALADRAAVLEGGRVVDERDATELLLRPATAFAARLAGMNLLPDGDGAWVFGPDALEVSGPDGDGLPATVREVTVTGGHCRVQAVTVDGTALVAQVPAPRHADLRPGAAVRLQPHYARASRAPAARAG
ncbi:ABC transporter ATP-binding protein [Tsukamurella serpentis]